MIKKSVTTGLILFLVFLFLAPQHSYGGEEAEAGVTVQEKKVMKHAFLVDPVGIGVGAALGRLVIVPEYQWAFHRYLALDIQPGYAYWKEDADFTHPPLHAFTTLVGLRIYPQGRALGGFYIVPRAQVAYAKGGGETLTVMGSTLELGYSWTWGPPGLILNAGCGGGGLMSVGGSLNDAAGNYLIALINFSIGFGL